ncbi:transforming growth factor beta activator LRRC33 [Brienomyrus brachyistius]|uniref:transforming growth factor beta activator LRRC33 n=1 Tax=Brienomyrus brachyistius TaxID=42636 RepID=UPI0020B17EB2|nr:transforming growth factor beta activator LRRC33 [Brienomyrus brachyistius]
MPVDDHMMGIVSNLLPCLVCFSLGLAWNLLMQSSCLPLQSPCKLVEKTAFCSHCQLSSVPGDLPEDIDELQLNHNPIKVLHSSGLSRYPALSSLSCTNALLDAVEINSLYTPHMLEKLNLADNNLHAGYQQTGWVLHTLVNLRSLDLSGNGLTEDMVAFLLENMTSLEYLYLSRNMLLRLDESTFRDLHRLRELDLDRNMLFEIDGAFDGLQDLQRLTMAFNRLPCLIQFQLTQLVLLNASHNSIEWFVSNQNLEDTFELETLDLSSNSLLFFPFLPTKSHIRHLLLADNRISFYEHFDENTSPNWTTTVQFSNLDSNASQVSAKLWDESLHGEISTLHLLDLSRNQVSYLPQGFLSKLKSLKRLKLQKNCLESFDLRTEELPVSLQELDISDNSLYLFKGNHSSWNKLRDLMHVNLSFNALKQIPSRLFQFLPSLKTADLSYNHIGICSSEEDAEIADDSDCVTWRSLASLRELYLAGCDLGPLPSSAFEGTQLTHLELSENTGILIRNDSLMSLNRTLQHLGLGNTGTSHLDFTPFHRLRSLNMSVNFLFQLPESMMSLDLRWLNLMGNELTTIPPHQARILAQRLHTVFLGGNPFNCCNLGWYQLFKDVKSLSIEDQAEMTCLLLNGGRQSIEARPWAVCEDKGEPSWWYVVLFLPVVLSLMGVTVVFLITFRPKLLPRVIKKTWQRPTSY